MIIIQVTTAAFFQSCSLHKSIYDCILFIYFLLQLACRSGLDSRAISLCETMPSVEVVKLAAKYAAKLGKHHLAEKVTEVANKMSKMGYIC